MRIAVDTGDEGAAQTVDRKRPCHLGGFATVHVGVDLSVGEVGDGDDCLPDAGLLAQ